MGEQEHEVLATLPDLWLVGVDIVTIGQYLRPSRRHLPVARFWTPDQFEAVRVAGMAMGFAHVQASTPPVRAITPERPRRRPDLRPLARVPATGPRPGALTRGSIETTSGRATRPRWRHERMARVRARMAEFGVDALLLSHGADLRG